MIRERILVDIETVEQARKIEETVKSGYLEATIEHLVQWIAVEEDLISSYNLLVEQGKHAGGKEMFTAYSRKSAENLTKLNAFLEQCEQMATERQGREEELSRLERAGAGH